MSFYKNIVAFVLIITMSCSNVHAQITDSISVDTTSNVSKLKSTFLPIPVFSSSPELGVEFGAAALFSFYLSKNNNPLQRNSTLNVIGTYTTNNQSKVLIKGDWWTKDNKWLISPYLRFSNYPGYYYGTGDDTKYEDRELINEQKIRASITFERRVYENFFIGSGFWYEKHRYSIAEPDGIGPYEEIDLNGKTGGNTVYLPFMMTFDNRDVVNYPYRGGYAHFKMQNSLKGLGSDYSYSLMTFDLRKFVKVSSTVVIGAQFYAQTIQGSDIPFYQMPQMGNDERMRGYYTGRYREQNYITSQMEVKYRPWAARPDAGLFSLSRGVLAAFAGYGSVFDNGGFKDRDLKPTYGIGARYIFDPRNRLTLRVDYAVGEQVPGEDKIRGVYISLNEAF